MILLLIPLCTKERSMASTRRLLRGARGLPRPGDRREFALLVEEGRIRSVGSEGELQRDFPGAEEVDLRGAILLPGFIDTHTHLFEWARRICGIDLDGISDPARLREELLQQRRAVDDGREWIGGSGWDPVLARKGLDRALLDEIFGRAPVVLQSRDFHTMWCSTEALRRAGVFEGAAPPPGGEIGRRPDGSPRPSDIFQASLPRSLVLAVGRSQPHLQRGASRMRVLQFGQKMVLVIIETVN